MNFDTCMREFKSKLNIDIDVLCLKHVLLNMIFIVLLLHFNKLSIIQMFNVNGKKKVLIDDQVVVVIVEKVWVARVLDVAWTRCQHD